MSFPDHTEGPWAWDLNLSSKRVSLQGGKATYDLTVVDFIRWGMNGAKPRFRTIEPRHMNIMKPAEIWAEVRPGREHHADWSQHINHPDADLMAEAPAMALVLELISRGLARIEVSGTLREFCYGGMRYGVGNKWAKIINHIGWQKLYEAVNTLTKDQ